MLSQYLNVYANFSVESFNSYSHSLRICLIKLLKRFSVCCPTFMLCFLKTLALEIECFHRLSVHKISRACSKQLKVSLFLLLIQQCSLSKRQHNRFLSQMFYFKGCISVLPSTIVSLFKCNLTSPNRIVVHVCFTLRFLVFSIRLLNIDKISTKSKQNATAMFLHKLIVHTHTHACIVRVPDGVCSFLFTLTRNI